MSCIMLRSESARDVTMPKPVNVFYIWYSELCRRVNMQPLSIVKPAKPKNQTILDFTADRIKAEEWTTILNALRLDTSLHVIAIRSRMKTKFLQEVNTEEKAKNMKRRGGSLHTDFIFRSLLKSLANCVRRSDVLSALELDGMPLSIDYIDILLEALKKNKAIKMLSLKYSPLEDHGCQALCNALKEMPNIQLLNLTGCKLGPLSAQYIAKVVKFQQINRYCESWHNSLRYEDPEVGIMAGLKRITLNNNPDIGDEGLIHILSELDDDLWIKALDMQRCGITENVAPRLLDVIEYSRSLEVADFRHNEALNPKTIERVLSILMNKQQFGSEVEYQWCATATTLNDTDTASIASTKVPNKSKSVPCPVIRNSSSTSTDIPLRRMKTCTSINKKPSNIIYKSLNTRNILEAKNNVLTISSELQKEMAKRKESELENKKLKQELDKLKSFSNISQGVIEVSSREKVVKYDPIPQDRKQRKSKTAKSKVATFKVKPRVEFVFENNYQAHNILQNLIKQNVNNESDDEEDITFYKDMLDDCKNDQNDDKDDGSNSSLIKLMADLNNSGSMQTNNPWMNVKNAGCFQKIYVR